MGAPEKCLAQGPPQALTRFCLKYNWGAGLKWNAAQNFSGGGALSPIYDIYEAGIRGPLF